MWDASLLCRLSDAARNFIHNDVVMRSIAAQQAADAEDRIVLLRFGEHSSRRRNFECTGDADQRDVFFLGTGTQQSVVGALKKTFGDERVKARDDYRKAFSDSTETAFNCWNPWLGRMLEFYFFFRSCSPHHRPKRSRDAACCVSRCKAKRGKPRLYSRFELLPLKRRRTLLEKRCSPFFLIFGRATKSKQSRFQKQALGQSHLHPLVDRLHRVLHCQRSIRDDLSRNRLRPRNQLRRRSYFIHQPNAIRFLRRDHLPRQHYLHRESLAHQPRQPLRPAISRKNSQLHLRLPQLRVIAGETHGASQSQFASAA